MPSLVLPFTISVFGIFLMRQFFLGVPDDLIDAARIDGMSEYGIVWSVMAPTAIPALVAFGIFSVVAHWNDYFWPLIAVGEQSLYTPPLGIALPEAERRRHGLRPAYGGGYHRHRALGARLPRRATPLRRGHHLHADSKAEQRGEGGRS